jgi:hypothetical protein
VVVTPASSSVIGATTSSSMPAVVLSAESLSTLALQPAEMTQNAKTAMPKNIKMPLLIDSPFLKIFVIGHFARIFTLI